MTALSGIGTEFVTTEDGKIFVDLDAVIQVGQNSYDLACERSIEEARLAASFTELFRKFKRDCEAQLEEEDRISDEIDDDLRSFYERSGWGPGPYAKDTKPLIGEADPELERLLREEEEIERRTRGDGDYKTWRHQDGSVCTLPNPDQHMGNYYGLQSESKHD